MACSLRDAVFAIDGTGKPWSAQASFSQGFWPPLGGSGLSLQRLACRFGPVGVALRAVATGGADIWDDIDRAHVVSQLRDRIRDPGIMRQNPTSLCGPFAIIMELARRRPVRYVKAAG